MNTTKFLEKLLNSKQWPIAVSPELIVDENNEEEKIQRADSIIEIMFDIELNGKKFLDFGCGQGHIALQTARRKTSKTVGYDIEIQNWQKLPQQNNMLLTTNINEIISNGPYDLVLIYDVLDHIVNEDPIISLKIIRQILNPNGFVYVRCHPFCSRHGTHLYRQLNKAYAHLVFSEDELGIHGIPTRKVIHPIIEYDKMFKEAGFAQIKLVDNLLIPHEPFFEEEQQIAERIKSNWSTSLEEPLRTGRNFPSWQLSQQFLDYMVS